MTILTKERGAGKGKGRRSFYEASNWSFVPVVERNSGEEKKPGRWCRNEGKQERYRTRFWGKVDL